jgi:DNA-binding response OmpR family regulator
MLPLLLVITFDRATSEPLRREIGATGFKAYYVESLSSALGVVAQWHFDAILLDATGFGDAVHPMLERLENDAAVPILLVLDGASDEDEQLRALGSGASQLVVGQTSTRVVAAQLRRLIDVSHKRHEQDLSEVRFGPLRLDPRRATASVGATPITLTAGEFELLLVLASRPGELVHRQTIARTFGHAQGSDARRSADMHVCRIRRKLRDAGGQALQVETVYGRGYLLRLASEARDDALLQPAEWSV